MLAESTIKRQMSELRKIIDDPDILQKTKDQAYDMETALQWVLGGCKWTPIGCVNKAIEQDVTQEKQRRTTYQGEL